MRDIELSQLHRDTEDLRHLLASCSTRSIVGSCAAYWFRHHPGAESSRGLLSPAKQLSFLLGLMSSTPEPSEPQEFGAPQFDRASVLLNKIFSAYAYMFFPEPGETVTEKWRQDREVAMPAFLAYLNQGFLASTEQVEERIRRYISPFDDRLRAEIGFNATQALTVCRWIADKQQRSLNSLIEKARLEKDARLDLIKRAKREGWNIERLREEAQDPAYRNVAMELWDGIAQLPCVTLRDLTVQFGTELASAFWRRFSIGRGEIDHLTYPTDFNLAEEKSLYRIDEEHAMCPLANQLFLSVLVGFERRLAAGTYRASFFKKRDALLEGEVEGIFRRLIGPAGAFFPSVFETDNAQWEHDLVIRIGRAVLLVEAKASPPIEPFRDPDRAFARITNFFRSDRGVQHAFNQGQRLWKRWATHERVVLYDKDGRLAYGFDFTEVDEVFIVCATRDNFGDLAVDLSLLLEKDPEDPYPWCVNVIDADAIACAWEYFGWDAARFLSFLRERVRLHGRVISSDELEVVGFFINHGGLHWLVESSAGDRVALGSTDSDVFDRIYEARRGGPPVLYEPSRPDFVDLRETLTQGRPVRIDSSARPGEQVRNSPCACGSGKTMALTRSSPALLTKMEPSVRSMWR